MERGLAGLLPPKSNCLHVNCKITRKEICDCVWGGNVFSFPSTSDTASLGEVGQGEGREKERAGGSCDTLPERERGLGERAGGSCDTLPERERGLGEKKENPKKSLEEEYSDAFEALEHLEFLKEDYQKSFPPQPEKSIRCMKCQKRDARESWKFCGPCLGLSKGTRRIIEEFEQKERAPLESMASKKFRDWHCARSRAPEIPPDDVLQHLYIPSFSFQAGSGDLQGVSLQAQNLNLPGGGGVVAAAAAAGGGEAFGGVKGGWVQNDAVRMTETSGLLPSLCSRQQGKGLKRRRGEGGGDPKSEVCQYEECRKKRATDDLLVCNSCKRAFHGECCDTPLNFHLVSKFAWNCNECKSCSVCHSNVDENKLLICECCDNAFHLYCLDPPLDKVPEGDWICAACAFCGCCGRKLDSLEAKDPTCFFEGTTRGCPECLFDVLGIVGRNQHRIRRGPAPPLNASAASVAAGTAIRAANGKFLSKKEIQRMREREEAEAKTAEESADKQKAQVVSISEDEEEEGTSRKVTGKEKGDGGEKNATENEDEEDEEDEEEEEEEDEDAEDREGKQVSTAERQNTFTINSASPSPSPAPSIPEGDEEEEEEDEGDLLEEEEGEEADGEEDNEDVADVGAEADDEGGDDQGEGLD
uniref:PHD-type domain-containing protein n=1 Tax=Chromera velia CCMP2878 TaxID=1169474 RepID=A0A0G4I3C6_9ALVE